MYPAQPSLKDKTGGKLPKNTPLAFEAIKKQELLRAAAVK